MLARALLACGKFTHHWSCRCFSLATLDPEFGSLGSAAKSGISLHNVLHCYASIPLMLVYLSTILYELLIRNLSVHKRSANGIRHPFLCLFCLSQQPTYTEYYSMLLSYFSTFPHSIFRIPAFTVFFQWCGRAGGLCFSLFIIQDVYTTKANIIHSLLLCSVCRRGAL